MRAHARKYVNRILNNFFAAMIIKCISVQDIRVSQFCFFTIFRLAMENLIYTLNHFIGMENPRTPCGRQYGTWIIRVSLACEVVSGSLHISHAEIYSLISADMAGQ